MLHHGFLRSSAWMLMIPVLMGSGGCWGRDGGSPDEEVCGFLGTAVGIEGAYVHVYPLDEVTGRLLKAYPIASTSEPTDANGEFCLTGKDSDITGMLLFVARGGKVREYWSPTSATLGVEHLSAVVEHWTKGRPLSITPWTTISYNLAKGRYRNGEEETFYAAVLTAEQLVYEHFIGSRVGPATLNHCSSRLNCLRPNHNFPPLNAPVTSPEAERYTVTLLSLSSLASEWSGPSFSTKSLNSVELTTRFLAVDALDGRFDGFETNLSLETNVNTLRSEIVRAFATNGPMDSPYSYADHRVAFQQIATNTDPRLFGEGPLEPIDDTAPSINAMPSPILDERYDRIVFDDHKSPIHIHDHSFSIPLESAFSSACPEVHKHVNLLDNADLSTNPLQWHFSIRDEVTGVADIRAEVSVGASYYAIEEQNIQIKEKLSLKGNYEVSITVTADDVPALLVQESIFKIAIWATDRAGNKSNRLEGCWMHVPRAAPLWLGPVEPSHGPGSLNSYSLAEDNLSQVLNGWFARHDAPTLVEFEIMNPNNHVVYLALTLSDVTGEFAWTWAYDYVLTSSNQETDSCVQWDSCMPEEPISRILRTLHPNPSIPSDGALLTATDDSCYGDCSDVLLPIQPKTSVRIWVRWSNFAIMLPEDIVPGELGEFSTPFDGQRLNTGTIGDYTYCLLDNGDGSCTGHEFYEERIIMRDARLDVRGIISGKTSADPFLTPRTPMGQEYSFGVDFAFAQSWVTNED